MSRSGTNHRTVKRVMYVLNSPDLMGGANTGLLQLLGHLSPQQFKSYLVVPTTFAEEQRAFLANLVDGVEVIPFTGWARDKNLPLWKQALITVSSNRRTLFHTRPVRHLCRLIQKLKIDLIYTNSALVVDGGIAAQIMNRPHIWHIKEWIGSNGSTHFWIPDFFLFRLIAALSTRIPVMSRYLAELFSQKLKTSKVCTIYDGIEAAPFSHEGSGKSLRQRLGIAEDEVVVGAAGSLTSSLKRYDIFVEVAALLAKKMPKARFVHFGRIPSPSNHFLYNGGWQRYRELEQRVKRAGLEGRFLWAGAIPFTEIPQMMDAIDVFVHPCDVEGFGRVAIEAMAARRPVVGPARGGIAESVIDGETGFLVPPNDVQAFAAATEKLLLDPQLRQRMGKCGRMRVEAEFSVERHVQRMTEVFENVLSSR